MLKDWPRSYYRHDGGDPFLFFVVYGAIDLKSPLSRTSYRSEGLPDGMELMHYGPEQHAEVVSGFREGFLWDRFIESDSEVSAQVGYASECVVLRGVPTDSSNLNYLRDTIGLLTHFLDQGGLCVYDPQMFHWWKPEEWRERIFAPDAPVPRHQVVILTSSQEDANLTWFHTRGLRKFGRPDLSIRDVPQSSHLAIIDLCNRLIEQQAFGGIIPEGQRIQMSSLPEGMTCHHAGDLDDPDFNNVHVEIRWPSATIA